MTSTNRTTLMKVKYKVNKEQAPSRIGDDMVTMVMGGRGLA